MGADEAPFFIPNRFAMARFLLIILSFFMTTATLAQAQSESECKDMVEFYPNGKLWKKYTVCGEELADTMFIYRKNGDLESWYDWSSYDKNQAVAFQNNLKNGACRKVLGQYTVQDEGLPVNIGIWKYYWKNGQVMDSLIYKDGEVNYQAHFSKKGVLEYEVKGEERIFYKKDLTIKLKEAIK